ncbi:hypothetical protein A2866_03735 [Candidatus Roizmanbacteria bacterium RIFCSPHIGHO2_01_FULL_39_8]|uniref:Uncharacterized protein n=2 Tax=Candidatus Roizmaniibacteriota TaxID=1752723 RepID=A0A1F7GLN0_9BACT|nr:MAG: hypothetical protein A2866_03735 [Candidatus Roizmanbacteria bacterium RIFCSPHIGHO2_01_FULL_39_8]OGK27178.1 MAG: hypothetical protein A3C28_06585 [Candidatus Roizmanbacteria bacterium RIFCSPHIGHO2_02_FULL_39_9]
MSRNNTEIIRGIMKVAAFTLGALAVSQLAVRLSVTDKSITLGTADPTREGKDSKGHRAYMKKSGDQILTPDGGAGKTKILDPINKGARLGSVEVTDNSDNVVRPHAIVKVGYEQIVLTEDEPEQTVF